MPTPQSACPTIRPRLEAWAREALPETERAEVAAHLAGCAGCHAAAAAIDPAALFLAARGGALPKEFWASFDRTLAERLAAERRRPTVARWTAAVGDRLAEVRAVLADAWRPALWAAPAAAGAVLLVTLALFRPATPPQIAQAPRLDGIPSPYAPPRVRPNLAPGGPVPGGVAPVPGPADGDGLLAAPLDPPTLEEVASPSARVYRFDTAGEDSPPIYFVVDESIDI